MGQCIWFGTQPSCPVGDQVIEPREVLRPTDLEMHELLGGCEVLKVLVIGEHKYNTHRALEVVVPLSEGLEYCEQFLALLGFGVHVIFMKAFQDMSDVDLMIFQ